MIKLSIIVPVYNVEPYIRPCFESIFNQGLYDDEYEVIIVNDGSTDKSMEKIADIISQHNNVTVINQENQGLSVARNNGIAKAKGEYILMPDSDDLLIDNSISIVLETALKTKADMVVADFLEAKDNEIECIKDVHQKDFCFEEKTGEILFLNDLDPSRCQVWRTLYRREFLSNNCIRFIPDIFFQDIPFTHECYMRAKKCIKASWQIYIYRRRYGAATASFSPLKAKSHIIAVANTWELRQMNNVSTDMKYKLEENLYYFFFQLVYKTVYSFRKISERNAVMDLLLSTIPQLSFNHGFKQKLNTLRIRHWPHLYINLFYIYAQIVYRKWHFTNILRTTER